jgi:hypothetical protein
MITIYRYCYVIIEQFIIMTKICLIDENNEIILWSSKRNQFFPIVNNTGCTIIRTRCNIVLMSNGKLYQPKQKKGLVQFTLCCDCDHNNDNYHVDNREFTADIVKMTTGQYYRINRKKHKLELVCELEETETETEIDTATVTKTDLQSVNNIFICSDPKSDNESMYIYVDKNNDLIFRNKSTRQILVKNINCVWIYYEMIMSYVTKICVYFIYEQKILRNTYIYTISNNIGHAVTHTLIPHFTIKYMCERYCSQKIPLVIIDTNNNAHLICDELFGFSFVSHKIDYTQNLVISYPPAIPCIYISETKKLYSTIYDNSTRLLLDNCKFDIDIKFNTKSASSMYTF